MFFRHGFKSVLRDKKSFFFFLLSLLSVVLCAASLATGASLNSAVENCKKSYITIGTVEYTGDNYPNDSLISDKITEIADGFSPEIADGLISFNKTENAFCVIENNSGYKNHNFTDSLVIAVKVLRQENDTYFCRCEQTLFSEKDFDGLMIKVNFGDFIPETNHTYLINGRRISGGSYSVIAVEEFSRPFLNFTENTAVCDITYGENVKIPENSIFYKIADCYKMRSEHLLLTASDSPNALYPFQQGFISLTEGSVYEKNSLGCVISADMAKCANVSVGESITVSTAARKGICTEDCYFDNFDVTFSLTVTGIFNGDSDYLNCIFVSENTPAVTETLSYTIGQFRFENGKAEEYLSNITLPQGVRVTVFDQGYGKAVTALEDMSLLVNYVCRICLIVGCAFLFLCAYLIFSSRKNIPDIMERLGVNRWGIYLYFICCVSLITLPAAILGCFGSHFLCKFAVSLMSSFAKSETSPLELFSRDTYVAAISSESLFSPPTFSVSAIISLAAFFCLLALTLACVAFAKMPHRKIAVHKSIRSAKTRSLKGGALKYSLLSSLRNVFRTFVPVILIIASSAMFFFMTSSVDGYRQSYTDLQYQNSVSGFFTDIYGQKSDGLVLDVETVKIIKNTDGISNVTAGYSMPYSYLSKNGEPFNDDTPNSSFAIEAYITKMKQGNRLVFTDNILSSPEFLLAKSASVDYLEGYDESMFSSSENNGLCVIPSRFAEENGIQKGDTLTLSVLVDIGYSSASLSAILPMSFLVAGTFDADNGDGNIYVPISAVRRDDSLAIGDYYGYVGPTINFRTDETDGRKICDIICINMDPSYSFATFTVNDCTKLESAKQSLYSRGFSQVRQIRSMRSFLVFNDSSYLQADRSARQRLNYMEMLFPAVYVLTLVLSFVISYLSVSMRRREIFIMHSLGQKKSSVFAAFFTEQLLICLICIAVILPLLLLFSGQTECIVLFALFILLWLLGCATYLYTALRR